MPICDCDFHIVGMDDQGLYRVVGVNSKVNKLIQLGLGKIFLVYMTLSGMESCFYIKGLDGMVLDFIT